MQTVKDILEKLIGFPSITPMDAGCQDYMIEFFEQLGFNCQRFDQTPVSNFFARIGTNSPLLVFAGHTDVVPVGDEDSWLSPPFTMHEQNNLLYGRGVADMKGSLACMMIAAARFIETCPDFSGSLGFLITSGEEGDHYRLGTAYVMEQLEAQGTHIDYCVVGEPSSIHDLGDMIKIGRRGSLNAHVTLKGKQGHVAYPHLAENPIHTLSPVLHELSAKRWDEGNEHFPPTSFQVTHIHSGGHANNIIPGLLHLSFNFRYSTEFTANQLQDEIKACFAKHDLNPSIDWALSGEPFLTKQGLLLENCIDIIETHTGKKPELSTSGGTSDARFIAPYQVEVIELGPINATIHQVNECVALSDLERLSVIYYDLCLALLEPINRL